MPHLRLRLSAALAGALLALGLGLWLATDETSGPPTLGQASPLDVHEAVELGAFARSGSEREASTARVSSEDPSPETPTTLVLRAIHADGTPAPDIALAVRTAPRREQLLRVTTDARGEAHVPNARGAILGAAAGSLLELAILGILPEPTPVLLEPRRCFEEPTIVVLPPLAELELRVVRANGALLEHGSAEVMTQAEHGGKPPRGFGLQSFPWWKEVAGGGVSFTRIQAEVPLFIAVQDAAWKLELLHPHPGLPRGERTALELRFDQLRGLTRARVLDGRTNTPLARSPLQVSWITVDPKSSMSSGFAVTTDDHGVFYFGRAARSSAVELWIEIGEPKLGQVRSAVPLGLGDALYDLGDLVIQPFRPRVSGRVVDEQGTPVPRAEVEARVIVESPEDTSKIRFEHFAARLYADDAGRFAWNAPPVSSDPGVEARAQISLRAYDATRRSREERVSVGALDVEVAIHSLGSFQGRLELDPRVPFHVLVLEHRLAGDESPSAWTQFYAAAPTNVEVNGLEPGRYDFRVRLAQTEEGALLVPGIEVHAGERTRDPRLDPLDLRTAFAVFDFEIAHPSECIPYDLRFTLTRVAGGSALQLRGSMVSATRAATLALTGSYDAVFETPGFQTVVLRGLSAGQRVELQPAHLLRLRIDPPAAHPISGGSLELVLRRPDTRQELVRPIDAAGGELSIPLSQPGRYDLLWRKKLPASEGGALVPLGAGEPAFLEIAATEPETAVRIAPPR